MDYSTRDLKLLSTIVESAEARLESQLAIALAADQRALIFAGFLSAAIIPLLAASLALIRLEPPQALLSWITFGIAGAILLALALVVYTTRPINWYLPGSRPKDWIDDIKNGVAPEVWLAERAADCERKAAENSKNLARHSRMMLAALIVTAISMFVGLLTVATILSS